MNKSDYYQVLELTRACTPQDIRQSYRKLALRWHPDKCGGVDKSEAQMKFNEINEAYTVLNDPSKKKAYDDFGHQGLMTDNSLGGAKNKFFEKCFKGAEKSAFDVLNDILKEKEDDYFFQGYEGFGISDNFKSSIKTFIEDNVFQNEQDVSSTSFFDTYKPTFMNPSFFMESSTLFGTESDRLATSSFSFESTDEEDRAYLRTSTTVIQNDKSTVQKDETTNQDKKHFTNKTDDQTPSLSEKPKVQRASYILITPDVQDDPLFTYARDAEFYAALELSREMAKATEANSNINTASKKISKDKEGLNIRLMKKKPSKKNRN